MTSKPNVQASDINEYAQAADPERAYAGYHHHFKEWDYHLSRVSEAQKRVLALSLPILPVRNGGKDSE